MPPKKRYNSRFPPVRIKKIMQSDEEIGKVAAAVPVLISRAIELFMVRLLRDAEKQIQQRNARTLTPQHIKQAIMSHQCMHFLEGLVANIPDNYQQSTSLEKVPSRKIIPKDAIENIDQENLSKFSDVNRKRQLNMPPYPYSSGLTSGASLSPAYEEHVTPTKREKQEPLKQEYPDPKTLQW